MTYKQLTQCQRYQIKVLLKSGKTQTEIAEAIGVHKSTISRELKRNKGKRGYRPKQAHRKATSRRKQNQKRIQPQTWSWIEEKIREDWSPEQITLWMNEHRDDSVSHEWIYLYIYADKRAGGKLHKHLRCQKKRRKRYGSNDRRGKIPDRVSIEERPAVVEERKRLGDWEADTMLGKKNSYALVTLVERKSRFTLLKKIDNRTAEAAKNAIVQMLKPYPTKTLTITCDNGKEFADHQEIAEELDTDVYFAHAYASWERGTNENTNGLVRQYFPKGSDFSKITDEDTQFAKNRLNTRPRKCLDIMTPEMVFFKSSAVAVGT
ncbi:MAG: IS30 family transposase [Anaerolineales bacterium]|nr:IS30 family transposase [Anaerolineales bacterium]